MLLQPDFAVLLSQQHHYYCATRKLHYITVKFVQGDANDGKRVRRPRHQQTSTKELSFDDCGNRERDARQQPHHNRTVSHIKQLERSSRVGGSVDQRGPHHLVQIRNTANRIPSRNTLSHGVLPLPHSTTNKRQEKSVLVLNTDVIRRFISLQSLKSSRLSCVACF